MKKNRLSLFLRIDHRQHDKDVKLGIVKKRNHDSIPSISVSSTLEVESVKINRHDICESTDVLRNFSKLWRCRIASTNWAF